MSAAGAVVAFNPRATTRDRTLLVAVEAFATARGYGRDEIEEVTSLLLRQFERLCQTELQDAVRRTVLFANLETLPNTLTANLSECGEYACRLFVGALHAAFPDRRS